MLLKIETWNIEYKAFIRQDKESAKLIQAASYTYSFYTFLKKLGKLDEHVTQFNIVGYSDRGVLASLCQGLHAVISDNLAKSVVATVSIQSLQKTTGGKDTLMHLEKIFQDAYNKREGHVIDANLRAIAQRNDLYYAIPLFAFISHDALASYYASSPQEAEKTCFRDLLSNYIRTITRATGILPIGQAYSTFPFLLFRSYSLEQMRQKRFTDRQLLTSNELNVLNLILSS